MSAIIQGQNVSYHQLHSVSPELLDKKLREWVASRDGAYLIQWLQISIMFCHVVEAVPADTSIVRFGHDKQSSSSLSFAPELRPYQHLLFIQYDSNQYVLRIYGDLSLTDYFRIQTDLGYITLADLRTDLQAEPNTTHREMYSSMAGLKPYYNLPSGSSCTVAELVLATDTICAQVLGLQLQEDTEEASFNADLEALLRNDKNNPLGFLGALVIAASHTRFRDIFVERELRLLRYRLEVCYTNEHQRAWFVTQWFPDLLSIQVNSMARYLCHPDGLRFCPELRVPSVLAAAQQLQPRVDSYCEQHYPDKPQSGLYFQGDLQFFPEAIQRGTPCIRGQVILTHHDLGDYLYNYLEHSLNERIADIQLRCATTLVCPLWSKIERHNDSFRRSDIARFVKIHGKISQQIVLEGLQQRKEFSFMFTELHFDREFLEEFVLPFVRELDGDLGEWQCEPVLQQPTPKYDSSATVISDTHTLPRSYTELIAYAKLHWPPCMRAIVKNCRGKQHLRYEARLKMAALIRICGYNEAQGSELWRQLFSETDVYKNAPQDFLETEQGQVISYDYKQNRQENLAISCKRMIADQRCPMSSRCHSTDIEDCQTACLANFNKHHSSALQFPISSPPNYFHLSVKRS